jgi:excisionase family DNA binding protein
MTDTFLTVDEAARRLAVTPYTMREWLKSGKVRGVQVSRRWRVPERALTEMATATTTETFTPPTGTDDAAEVEATKARLQKPLDPAEVEARRRAARELDALFARLNAEVEEETGEPLPRYTGADFSELVAAGYDERENEQL